MGALLAARMFLWPRHKKRQYGPMFLRKPLQEKKRPKRVWEPVWPLWVFFDSRFMG
jgi:hypothetical protein